MPGLRNGFGERAAKIAWRTHQDRVDALEVSVRDESGHADDRTWRRTELESAFGPRLAGRWVRVDADSAEECVRRAWKALRKADVEVP
ncbi:hypothetical protein [Thermomonospora amylolytica]|uniref:hypothetical protein n=1 Tax=Thermomonospora amylolytica TaxID=1411117 RepID=UPI000E6C329C|nr:hypothetical protein [Thermomonospora amylolytica]